jgi:hypothetical protein
VLENLQFLNSYRSYGNLQPELRGEVFIDSQILPPTFWIVASNVIFSFPDVAGSVWLWIEVANAGIPRVISLHTQVESAKNTTGTVLILSESVGAGNAVYLYVLL